MPQITTHISKELKSLPCLAVEYKHSISTDRSWGTLLLLLFPDSYRYWFTFHLGCCNCHIPVYYLFMQFPVKSFILLGTLYFKPHKITLEQNQGLLPRAQTCM